MIKNNRCDNCGHSVTDEMIAKNEGYKINDRFYLCGKCYALKYESALDYVKTHPNQERKIIAKCTYMPLSLIDMFCDNNNLIEEAKKKNLQEEQHKQDIMEEKDEKTKKLEMLRDLQQALNKKPESSMQRVIKAQENSKMRFLNQDHRRRF